MSGVELIHGDCLEVLTRDELGYDYRLGYAPPMIPDNSVDSVTTDPPYGLEFMGREWDGADGFRRSLNPNDVGRDNAFGRTSRTSPEYRTASKATASRRQEGGISQATGPSFLGGLNPKCLACNRWQRGSNPCRCDAPEWTQERLVRLHTFQEWCEAWSRECLRVLRPGGHMLAFGGTRTFHRLACAVEDAGFEVRDSIAWLYGSGFPKSRNLDGEWSGWGTALKPAFEPIVVARKPLVGTVAANVLAHGTGALNIDGCRIEATDAQLAVQNAGPRANSIYGTDDRDRAGAAPHAGGRWPANVVLDEDQAAALDEQSGERPGDKPGRAPRINTAQAHNRTASMGHASSDWMTSGHSGAGGASRFFFIATPDDATPDEPREPSPFFMTQWVADTLRSYGVPEHNAEQIAECFLDEGLSVAATEPTRPPRFFYTAKADSGERVKVDGIAHPTVKPLSLMRWLVRLVTPPGGTVLEPFAGSGTTVEACILEGFSCIAIEREADYLPLIQQRINRRRDPVAAIKATGDDGGLFDLLDGGAA